MSQEKASKLNPLSYFKSLKPDEKKKTIKYAAIVGGLFLAFFAYKFTRGSEPAKPVQVEKKKKISFEPELLQKSAYEDLKKTVVEREKALADKDKEVDDLKKQFEALKDQVAVTRAPLPAPPSASLPTGQSGAKEVKLPSGLPGQTATVRIPPPPPGFPKPAAETPHDHDSTPSTFPIPQPPQGGQQGSKAAGQGPQQKTNLIGGIGVVSQPPQTEQEKKKEEKESKRKFYLPPSFMEATMLSGVRAPTLEAAKSQPRPVFLRIKDVAVLPNEIKSNLKGCFIIASGYGDLSDERVHLRLEQLTCLAKNGESVIDAKVKGVVIDADAQLGVAGTVVTKAGAMLGRTILAGFFGGVGDAMKLSTQTATITPLGGTTQTLDTDKILTAGVGGGLSSGFNKLGDFYLEMARQTFPIIEAGATKVVTVAITEGVDLAIKDEICVGGLEECNK